MSMCAGVLMHEQENMYAYMSVQECMIEQAYACACVHLCNCMHTCEFVCKYLYVHVHV